MLLPGTGEPSASVTVKFDGAPAIICGIDPADGQFFVGTKSVFAKDAKLIKHSSDVSKYYSDKPGLAKKLETAFKYLRQLGIGGVVQGDFMFDEDTKVREIIDDKEMITFKPNTITYAVAVDSDIGRRIDRAKFGIIFHTRYEGPTLPEMTATFGLKVTGFRQFPDIWFDDAFYKDYTGIASLTDDENAEIIHRITNVRSALNKTTKQKVKTIMDYKELSSRFKPYVNELIRAGQPGLGDPWEFIQDFVAHYQGLMQSDIAELEAELERMKIEAARTGDKRKSVGIKRREETIAKRKETETKTIEFIEDHLNTILAIIAVYKGLIEIKNLLIKKLRKVEGLGTLFKTEHGYKVSNPEGFVAIGRAGGAVKLVDRLEFSHQNFTVEKTWKNP